MSHARAVMSSLVLRRLGTPGVSLVDFTTPNSNEPEHKALRQSSVARGGVGLGWSHGQAADVGEAREHGCPDRDIHAGMELPAGLDDRTCALISAIAPASIGELYPLGGGPSRDGNRALLGLPAAPPTCNTGVQSAKEGETPHGSRLLVDWLSFTMHPGTGLGDTEDELVERLRVELGGEWAAMEKGGRSGYARGTRSGAMEIWWHGMGEAGQHNLAMGVHCQLSGSACRDLEDRGIVKDWREFLRWLLTNGATFSRKDLAIQDRDGLISIDRVEQAFDDGLVSSHFKQIDRDKGKWIAGPLKGLPKGDTLYIGSRKSEAFIRMYNKSLEQGEQGQDVRVEMELKGARAQAAVEAFVLEGPEVIAQILGCLLDIKEPGEVTQRCRWNTAQWWQQFLQTAEKLRLVIDPQIKTVEKAADWLQSQVAPTLAMVAQAYGVQKFCTWLCDIGQGRWSMQHVKCLQSFLERQERDAGSVAAAASGARDGHTAAAAPWGRGWEALRSAA